MAYSGFLLANSKCPLLDVTSTGRLHHAFNDRALGNGDRGARDGADYTCGVSNFHDAIRDDIAFHSATDDDRIGFKRAFPEALLGQRHGPRKITVTVDLATYQEITVSGNLSNDFATFADQWWPGRSIGRLYAAFSIRSRQLILQIASRILLPIIIQTNLCAIIAAIHE